MKVSTVSKKGGERESERLEREKERERGWRV